MARALESSTFSSVGAGGGITDFSSATSFGASAGSGAVAGAGAGGGSDGVSDSTFFGTSSAISSARFEAGFINDSEVVTVERRERERERLMQERIGRKVTVTGDISWMVGIGGQLRAGTANEIFVKTLFD